jgi:hypothetical protein
MRPIRTYTFTRRQAGAIETLLLGIISWCGIFLVAGLWPPRILGAVVLLTMLAAVSVEWVSEP